MSKSILSLSFAVILSLSFLSACTKSPESTKVPDINVSKGEVREERHENGEAAGRENRNDDVVPPQGQVPSQPVVTPTPAPISTQTKTPDTVSPAPTTSSSSQARTVTKTISYQVPDGNTSTTFTLSIGADGVISSVTSAMADGAKDSIVFNRVFAAAISSQIVGKKLSDVASLSAVGGASLTTGAFNQFVGSL